MKYARMTYKRSRRLDNHETEQFEATVELVKGENPDMAFEDLKQFVEEKLRVRRKTAIQIAFEAAPVQGGGATGSLEQFGCSTGGRGGANGC